MKLVSNPVQTLRNSIVSKLWLTIVGMVILVLSLLSILLLQFFDNYVYDQQSRQMTRLATSVQLMVEENNLLLADKVAQQLAYVQHARLTLDVPFSTNTSLSAAYSSFSPSQRKLFDAGTPVVIRGTSKGVPSIFVYLIIPAQPSPGMLVVGQDMSVLDDPINRMGKLIVFASVLGILLATGLAFVVSKNLSRPLVEMNRVAEEMSKGNFNWQIEVVTSDEVGRLGRTFNTLASQLKGTIEALSLEKDQLSSILSSLEDGVFALDLSGVSTLANPPAIRILKSFSSESFEQRGYDALPHPMKRMFNAVIEKKRPEVRELVHRSRFIVVIMIPLYESDGERIRGVVSVLRDVTEERKLERLRKDFIANVSHELRTPLSMMQGYAEALLDEFGDDPVQRKDLTEVIYDETLRMRRLVNDLLDFAQLESGQFQMNITDVDIGMVLRRVGRKFQTLASERKIALAVHVSDDPLIMMGDFDRLEQVFTNLLDNAFRHTAEQGDVELSLDAKADVIKISVRDTGSGIPDEDIPYIWERFYKADKARTRGGSGTGLGLSISRHIVLEHGGEITVDSKKGIGTTFVVTLPKNQHEALIPL